MAPATTDYAPPAPDWAQDIANLIFDAPNTGEGRAVAIKRVAAIIADTCVPKVSYQLAFRADYSEVEALLEEISKIALHSIDLPLEISDELFAIDVDDCATSAGELIVRVKPSDTLLGFVTALRTGNRDSGVQVHSESPVGLSDSRVAETGGAHNPAGGGTAAHIGAEA